MVYAAFLNCVPNSIRCKLSTVCLWIHELLSSISKSSTRAGGAGGSGIVVIRRLTTTLSNADQTLISTTTTASTAPTKASIVLQTEDATGTATINTDIKAGVSRDALNYVDTTLAKIGTWGSGNVYAANDVTMPGTVMTKIITVAASKLVTDGTSQATLTLTEGYTYKFDTSDATLSGHTFSFATAADAAGSTQYTTGVTTSGTPGSANAYTQIVVAASAPTLYYYCVNHTTMGGTANTPAEAATTSMRYKVETKNQSYTAGTAGGTIPYDVSSNSHTITVTGDVVSSTTQKQFGTHGIYYDGTGDWLTAASSSDWAFGTSDFTVEFWYYGSNNASGRTSFMTTTYASGSSNDQWLIRNHGGYLKLGTWNTDIGASSILTPVNTWTHLAVIDHAELVEQLQVLKAGPCVERKLHLILVHDVKQQYLMRGMAEMRQRGE